MKKLRMLSTQRGAPEGHTTFTYDEGQVYDLPPSLADIFLKEGWAVEVKPELVPAPTPQEDLVPPVGESAAEDSKSQPVTTPKQKYKTKPNGEGE